LPLNVVLAIFEFVLLLFSLCVHEAAHAWTASMLGDQTARLQGRVTLNPAYHIDPIGTLLFPGIAIFGPLFGFTLFGGLLIGWARPTPVTTRNFRKIKRDDNLTTLAGPVSNLLLAMIFFVVLLVIAHVVPGGRALVLAAFTFNFLMEGSPVLMPVILLCTLGILVNVSLCAFNLLPVPPLDGSRIVRNMLPYNAMQAYDRIPMMVSYLLMIFFGGYFIRLIMNPLLALARWGLFHL